MKKHLKKLVITLMAAICLVTAIVYTHASVNKSGPGPADHSDIEKQSVSSSPLPRVGIIEAKPGIEQAVVTASGEVRPRYQVTLGAEVSGRVKNVSDSLAPGCRIKAGQRLLSLDDTDYKKNLAQAEKNLAEVNLALLQEQRKAEQAQDDWKRSGLSGKPESSLVLRKPQVESARASVRAAKASLEKAKQDIAHTLIRAPFDAVVVKSDIAPGSYVQPGTAIATLYSSDRAEIRLPLSAKQWALLPDEKILESGDWQVTIQSSDNTGKWEGRVIRVERHMDKTRQRALIAAVSNPFSQNPPLMPGTFVSASIPGAEMSRMLSLPSETMTAEGYIWYVTQEQTLERFRTDPLFQAKGRIYIKSPEGKTSLNILKQPLSGYLPGMKAVPVKEEKS